MLIDIAGVALRAFVPTDAPHLVELQRRCLATCPDISLLPEGFYTTVEGIFQGGVA
jgi:hypothetical protein